MSTIGDLERKAGIGTSPTERTAFWRQFHHLEGEACLNAGVAELRRLIAQKEARPDPRPKVRAVRRTRETLPPLTVEQEAALQAYAARHGRRWKSILSNAWLGGPPHDKRIELGLALGGQSCQVRAVAFEEGARLQRLAPATASLASAELRNERRHAARNLPVDEIKLVLCLTKRRFHSGKLAGLSFGTGHYAALPRQPAKLEGPS